MGGTHYFVLRQGGGQIFVTSLHFTTKKLPCLYYNDLQEDIAHQPGTRLIQFSVCISQHVWLHISDKRQRSNVPGKGLEVPCDEYYW